MGPDLWELYEYGEADDEVAAIIRLAHFGAVPAGVRVIAQFEEIITVRLQRGDIPKISGAPETWGMTAGDTYFGADLELDAVDAETLPARGAVETDHRRPEDLAMTGRGIVIGVVDWGFDFRHPDFRRADGSTRILALWDQRGGKQTNSPQPYGYGVVHTREAINKALGEKDPYAALRYHPADADTGIGCHGTHVASIAAGTGSARAAARHRAGGRPGVRAQRAVGRAREREAGRFGDSARGHRLHSAYRVGPSMGRQPVDGPPWRAARWHYIDRAGPGCGGARQRRPCHLPVGRKLLQQAHARLRAVAADAEPHAGVDHQRTQSQRLQPARGLVLLAGQVRSDGALAGWIDRGAGAPRREGQTPVRRQGDRQSLSPAPRNRTRSITTSPSTCTRPRPPANGP